MEREIPTAREFHEKQSGKVAETKGLVCWDCKTPLRPLPHYHTTGMMPVSSICCDCVKKSGLKCPLEK